MMHCYVIMLPGIQLSLLNIAQLPIDKCQTEEPHGKF